MENRKRKRWSVPWDRRSKRSVAAATVLAVVTVSATVAASPSKEDGAESMMGSAVAPGGVAPGGTAAADLDVDALAERAERARSLMQRTGAYYEREVEPIKRVLSRYSDDGELAGRIAISLVREANRVGLDPRLLLAVLLVENPWLDPEIRSSVGAVGLMQVMPVHRGQWAPCAPDLENIEANICHGARIFAHYFETSGGDVERALLRYNGCVRGTNTPDCHQYPYHVFARAGRASILAWLEPRTNRAASP